MTLHTLLSTVPSKSVPMTPLDGLEPVAVVVVETGVVLVVVAGGVLFVVDKVVVVAVVVAVPGRHWE